MSDNINLTKILKNCPKGWELWSPIFGVVKFEKNLESRDIVIVDVGNGELWTFNSDATFPIGNTKSIEIMLYPSRENRDWSKFTAPWYKLEKQGEQILSQTNERAWLYLVSDVLTWKNGIGQYLDDPRVQELAKRLCSKYAQKLYNPSILSNSSSTGKNKQKFDPKTLQPFDKVLVKNDYNPTSIWYADFVSYRRDIDEIPVTMYDCMTPMIIPYNEETKHLCGTSDDAPEYYRYWEDNEENVPKMSIK